MSSRANGWFSFQTLGLLILVGAIGMSVVQVLRVRSELADTSKPTLRIAFWQLEDGYRSAMQAMINKYEAMHDHKVKIVMMPVTEKVYAQWLNVNLISGTGPDLCEMGFAKATQDDTYITRYFMPLGSLTNAPNPYNAGTELESIPWRETFVDGMRSSYKDSLQDYFSAPTTYFAKRIYYNKDLLLAATGSDAPPATLGQWMAQAQAVREYGEKKHEKLLGIASCYYHRMITDSYVGPFTASLEDDLDYTYNGRIDEIRSYLGFAQGKWSMQEPRIKAYFQFTKALTEQMPDGFSTMDRQSAQFFFMQGKAGYLCTGSWDASGIYKFSRFRVGVFDCPMPGKGEPFSEFVTEKAVETSSGGAAYGVYKQSRHPKLALDFLHFLTSQKANEEFNKLCNWPPIVAGAEPNEIVRPFMPDPHGLSSSLQFRIGNQPSTVFAGQLDRYLQNEISYDDFAKQYEETLKNADYGGDRYCAKTYDEAQRQCRGQERVLAIHALRTLIDPEGADAREKLVKALSQQVRRNNGEDIRVRYEAATGRKIQKI